MKKFKFFSKNRSGRNNKGNITVFSKGVKKSSLSIVCAGPNRWSKYLSTVVGIIRNKKKLFSIQRNNTGSIYINNYIHGVLVGQRTFFSNLPQKYWINELPGSFVLLKFLKRYSLISNVFIKNKNKYATANGTYCQLLETFTDFNIVKLLLPSKRTVCVSGFCFVILGRNSQVLYKYLVLGKAGTLVTLGKKSKVRGVARNPVDHPHGGRTKTNKPEVSIWGWVAKKNK